MTAQPYDGSYWQSFRDKDQTPIGEQLTRARCELVARHWNGNLVDIGVGGGRFVGTRKNTYGFDVNPCAVKWLKDNGRWWDPYARVCDAVSFFDSLEHMHDPSPLLANVRRWVFVSIPIFRDAAHVLTSKHYKPEEHVFYFAERGLLSLMSALGWRCVESNDEETRIGREDIKSYAFKRAA